MLLYLAQLSARSGGHAPASLVAYRSQPYLQAANKDVPILCDLRSMRTDANWHQGFEKMLGLRCFALLLL